MTTYGRPSHSGVIGALVATVVVLGMVAAVAVFGRTTTTAGTPTADPAYRPQANTPAQVAPPETTTVTEQAPPLTTEPGEPTESGEPTEADAHAELNAIVDAHRPVVESLVGWWLPQLSSKRPGLEADGITYDYREILRDFRRTQTSHPDALLLYSGDYTSFKYGDFWITVVPYPSDDGASANSWCDSENIPADGCYAKLISHTVGYPNATLPR
jgi:hypothetical protein